MPETKEKREITEELFLGEIYKNAKMGADSIINLLPHVKEDSLRSVMTMQLDGYEKYAARAAEALCKMGLEAKEENIITRFSARIGVAINTMIDSTASHIAEMMIEGSNMGVTDMTKLLNSQGPRGACKEATRLAREIIAFEEHNLEMLKRYL
ncbi:MAG: hypothetical protein J6A84_04160 [Clostridia bacterium]|nr:hypothetical protein [Clostridia bacterium]